MSRSEPLTGGGEFAIGEPSMLGLPFGDHSSQTTCCQLPSRCSCDPRGNVLRVAVGSLANRFGKFGLERHGEAFNGHGPIILVLTIGVERLGRGRDAHTEGIQTQRFRRSSVSTRWPSSRSRPPLHATRRGHPLPPDDRIRRPPIGPVSVVAAPDARLGERAAAIFGVRDGLSAPTLDDAQAISAPPASPNRNGRWS